VSSLDASAGDAFIHESRQLLTRSHLPRIERAVERLTDADVWWRPSVESNSAGNLLLHLAGNVRQWIVSGVGGARDERRRQEEFDAREGAGRDELIEHLRRAVQDADAVLARLSASQLLERRHIQGFDGTVLYAIYHVVEHFAMHTGQILFIAKERAGDLALYDLSSGNPRETW
jgi:uncharacterized damage-inducible protein DinB